MRLNANIGSMTKRLGYGSRIAPARDWFVLLSLGMILVAASIAWNVFLLVKVERGETLETGTGATAFDAAPIESVRAIFNARAEEERRFTQEYRFVDPSR